LLSPITFFNYFPYLLSAIAFLIVFIQASVITVIAMATMRESNATTILAKKAARLRKETGKLQLRPARSPQVTLRPRQLAERALLRPIRMLILSPIVLLIGIYMAFVFGMTYLLFATFPSVFQETYLWRVTITGVAYMGFGIGCVLGLITFSKLNNRLLGNDGKPERRLILMMAVGPTVPIGIFRYGWSADRGVHWMGALVISSSVHLYMMDMFGP
jgi:hypothetical protein